MRTMKTTSHLQTVPFVRQLSGKHKQNYAPELIWLCAVAGSAYFWGNSLHTSGGILLFCLWCLILLQLFALTIANIRTAMLPNRLLGPLALTVIVYQGINAVQNGGGVIGGGLLGGLLLGGIPYLIFQFSAGRWIGGGDVKLGFIAGYLLGWKLALLCMAVIVVLTGLTFLAAYIAPKLSKGVSPATKVETGIFWTLAIAVCLVLGNH